MFTLKRKPLSIPAPGEALPGRPQPIPTAETSFRERGFPQGPLPARRANGAVRAGLLLGRRAEVLADPGRHCDGGGLCRRAHAEPDLRGGLLRHDRPQRGGARRVRPARVSYERPAQDVLGEPRPDPRHAPRERRRHAIPLGHLLLFDEEQRRAAEASKAGLRAARSRRAALAPSPPRSCRRPNSISPRTTTSNISPRTRTAIAGLGGTGVSCPIGTGVQSGA